MSQYVAIIEESGPDKAVGVWFPDLPGCFSAGDSMDEAISNAPAAVALYADSLEEQGRLLPTPRSLSELKSDPDFLSELAGHMLALIAAPERISSAAE